MRNARIVKACGTTEQESVNNEEKSVMGIFEDRRPSVVEQNNNPHEDPNIENQVMQVDVQLAHNVS
jgi:hypothetical protein